ncbi:MAG TPA: pyridoxal-5'-phosphate-dependent protein, partial [Thermoanaerobacterales bacterium]|nr:pyridoxal-5'-phosphate-dependent protein [Thermoanaerobacterales bacterium]
MVTIEDINKAYERLKLTVKRTPIDESRTISERTGGKVFLKAE